MPLLQRQRRLAHISLFELEWIPATYITDKGIGQMDDFGRVWVFEDVYFQGREAGRRQCLPQTFRSLCGEALSIN